MYVPFGEEMIDSEEIKLKIEELTPFKCIADLSFATKREDVIALHLKIEEEELKDILEEEGYDIEQDQVNSEELVEEFLQLSDEIGIDIENILEEIRYTLFRTYSYNYDAGNKEVKAIFLMAHKDLGIKKLNDVLGRLLKQV